VFLERKKTHVRKAILLFLMEKVCVKTKKNYVMPHILISIYSV